jgi:hypothetical protein
MLFDFPDRIACDEKSTSHDKITTFKLFSEKMSGSLLRYRSFEWKPIRMADMKMPGANISKG